MHPVEFIGLTAGAIGLSLSVPQLLRIRATGHTNGVSFPTWATFYLVYASWAAYGIRYGMPSQIITNVLAFTLATPLVIQLFRDRAPTLPAPVRWGTAALAATAAFLFTSTAPATLVDITLTSLCLVRLPQVITSWKNRNNPEPSNVSLATWTLSIISGLLWLTYALVLAIQPVLYITNGLNLFFSVAVLALELRRSRRPR